MEHFRVLPSDPRLEALTDEQAAVLFQYWLDYDEDIARRVYREKKAEEDAKPSYDVDELRAMGYPEDEIERIKRSLE